MYDHVSICMPSVQPQELTGQWALWLQVPAPHLCRAETRCLLFCIVCHPGIHPWGRRCPLGDPMIGRCRRCRRLALAHSIPCQLTAEVVGVTNPLCYHGGMAPLKDACSRSPVTMAQLSSHSNCGGSASENLFMSCLCLLFVQFGKMFQGQDARPD